MKLIPPSPRIARLLQECEASAIPALLLLVAFGVLLLLAALDALQPRTADAPAEAPETQVSVPVA